MDLTREMILRCWDDCHLFERNDLLEIVRLNGGMTAIPEFIPSTPEEMSTFGEFVLTVIRTMEHAQAASPGLWRGYIDVDTRRLTIAPREWIDMAVEAAVIDRDLMVVMS